MLTRVAADIEVVDEATRTIRLSFSSEFPVPRSSWFDEPWIEVLGHKPGEVDLSRMNGGACPALYDHNRFDQNGWVGAVDRAWLEGTKGRCELRLSKRADVDPLWQDIKDKIVRTVSVGYKIYERILTKKNDKTPSEYRVTRWMPLEVSFTPIPADPTVGVGRSERGHAEGRFFITDLDRSPDMKSTNTQGEALEAPDAATQAERTRVIEIQNLGARVKGRAEVIQRCIREGLTIEQTRAAVLEDFAARDVHHTPRLDDGEGDRVLATEGPRDNFERAIGDSLLLRAGVSVAKPHAAARDLRNMPVIEVMRSYLGHCGIRVSHMSPSELCKRAMTTSDFPQILTASVEAALRTGYETEPASHRAWVREQLVPDFKLQERPILGSAPGLLPVSEMGEYQDGPMDEDKATYQVAKYGRVVTLSWEMLVNDRLGAFIRVLPSMGQAARRLEADVVYALLAANSGAGPTMQDTVALFHATHGNLGTAGAFNLTTLGAGRTLLRKQQAVGGGYLALVPRSLIVPAELETAAEALIAQATRHTSTGVDLTTGIEGTPSPQWITALQLVVEPRLAAGAVYLAADAGQIDTIELGKLDHDGGQPHIEEEQKFRTDASSWKIRHVVGAKPLDWRGLIKLPIS